MSGDTSTRPRNLCWGISVVGTVLFVIGLVIMNKGNCSAMIPALVSAANVVLFGLLGAWRCSFARNQALEEQGVEEYRKEHGNTDLFSDADEAVRLATKANTQFVKYAVPTITVILGIIECLFCLITWRNWGRMEAFALAANPMPLAILGVCSCIGVLIAGSFFVGASREPGCRWLRPAGAWLFFTGFLFLAAGIALFLEFFGKAVDKADITVARIAMVILIVLAIELILSFVIEFYRPRMPGEAERPLPESRILALFTEPGGVARNVAASLDYQFGFQVSEAWFYRFLERTVVPLLVVMAIAFWLQTCIVVVNTEENGIRERFGKVVSETLQPGLYFKLPAPFERMHRFPVEHVQTINITGHEEEHHEEEEEEEPQDDGHGHAQPKKEKKEEHDERVILWSTAHTGEKEPAFVVAMHQNEKQRSGDNDGNGTLPLGLLSAHVPMYYKVTDMYAHKFKHTDPNKTLKNLATREFHIYMASTDISELLGGKRQTAGEELRERIQAAADEMDLGVKIIFVSMAGLHPPISVGPAYDQVVASGEAKQEEILKAQAYREASRPAATGVEKELLHKALSYKQEKIEVSKADAERFESQLKSFNAAPRVFMLNSYLELLGSNTNARKYVLATSCAKEVLELNLEKKINASLLDLNLDGAEEKTE